MDPGKGNIIPELRELENVIRRFCDVSMRSLEGEQPTHLQYWIIGYLEKNEEEAVFQRDIEKQFKMSPSATSTLLKLMESRGLITRKSVPGDARLKKLTLTEKSKNLFSTHINRIRQMDAYVDSTITPEEKAQFLAIAAKLRDALREAIAGNN